ncbi:hypothetical protein TNCT1_24120 [Streptomyces sp. 1-11]|nr:hypothetical protein TNCT1_24120 [Streptomyces sp. 1-11]
MGAGTGARLAGLPPPRRPGRADMPKGRIPPASNPGMRPFAVTEPVRALRSAQTAQTAMATSASPPCWATTVRSAVPPGTSARTVQVPSAA